MMIPEFKVRGPLPDDDGYILKTMGRDIESSNHRYPDGTPCMPKRLFFKEFEIVAKHLMRVSPARVVVPVSDASFIAAFVIAQCEPANKIIIVHYAQTRPPFRRLGLVKAALEDLGYEPGFEIIATHWTKFMNRVQRNDLILNERLLYGVK